MRSSGHIVYLCLIVLTAIVTYQLTSSTGSEVDSSVVAPPHQPQLDPTDEQTASGAPPASTDDPVGTAPQRVDPASNDDEALHARVAELEAEVADYQRAFAQLRAMPERLSPEHTEAMRAEGRHHEWATDTELNLETLFMSDERLRNIHIEEIECFSEHCELSLNHAHLEDGFPTQHLDELLRENESLAEQHFMIMRMGNSEHTHLTLTQNLPEEE